MSHAPVSVTAQLPGIICSSDIWFINLSTGPESEITLRVSAFDPVAYMNTTSESLILNVSPNPFVSNFRVSVLSAQEEDGSLNLYNVYGQAIQRNALSLRAGINEIDIIGEDLQPGLYYLHYRTLVSRIFIIIQLVKN